MTALMGREVDGTVSMVSSYFTGLTAEKTDQAAGEDLAELGKPFVGRQGAGTSGGWS